MLCVALALASCGPPSDAKVLKMLPGVWHVDANGGSSADWHSTMTVASNGHYVSKIISHDDAGRMHAFELEGSLQVKAGYLIETITKSTLKGPTAPMTNRSRIVRVKERTLVVKSENMTEESIFTKDVGGD
jgi:hypothetical protein